MLIFSIIFVASVRLCFSDTLFEQVEFHGKKASVHSRSVYKTTNTSEPVKCAALCDQEGNAKCQGFNFVKRNGFQRCQLVDFIPIQTTDFAEDDNVVLYERTCEKLYVVASLRDTIGSRVTTIVVDINRDVYKLHTGQTHLKYIGSVQELFPGFLWQVDDMSVEHVPFFGKVFGLRHGNLGEGFQAVDDSLTRFAPVPLMSKQNIFEFYETDDSSSFEIMIKTEEKSFVWLRRLNKTVLLERRKKISEKLDSSIVESTSCPDVKTMGFCTWLPLWRSGTGGFAYTSSTIGLFAGASFYRYDLEAGDVLERRQICKNRPLTFLL